MGNLSKLKRNVTLYFTEKGIYEYAVDANGLKVDDGVIEFLRDIQVAENRKEIFLSDIKQYLNTVSNRYGRNFKIEFEKDTIMITNVNIF